MKYTIFQSSICDLIIIGDKDTIETIAFDNPKTRALTDLLELDDSEFRDLTSQLERYFLGDLQKFHVNLNLQGTPFQKRVWKELLNIPYGETVSYKELAQRCDTPKAYRAVGTANRMNNFSIVIPCHRVINSNGELGGFARNLDIKKELLRVEGIDI